MIATAAPNRVRLRDGRYLAYDDVGQPDGFTVVYIHGTPDCRLSRHPDDAIAAKVGARLIAVDRPGYGDSDFDPHGTFTTFAGDLCQLVDALEVSSYATFGWSAGGPFALASAALDPERVAAVGVACSLAPIDALDVPGILDGAGEQIRLFADTARAMPTPEFAKIAAPILAPDMPNIDEVRSWLSGGLDDVARAELESVSGALDHLAKNVLYALQHGHAGVEHDVALFTTPYNFALADVHAAVRLWYGDHDPSATVAMGRYIERHLRNATLIEVSDASHFLFYTHWANILRDLATQGAA